MFLWVDYSRLQRWKNMTPAMKYAIRLPEVNNNN